MLFPESPRIFYTKNPLDEVICQLRFPTILRIGAGDVVDFQERMRQVYPLYERKDATWDFPSPGAKEVADLFEQLPWPKLPGLITHRFYTKDKAKMISLSQNFLALSDREYESWEQFSQQIKEAESAFREIYSPSYYSRIGLRYVDRIAPEDFNLTDTKWNDLLQPYLIGILGFNEIENTVKDIRTTCKIDIPDTQGATVTLRYGLTKDKEKDLDAYTIDADFAIENVEEKDGTFGILDRFHELAGRFFRWAITDTLHQAMGPRS